MASQLSSYNNRAYRWSAVIKFEQHEVEYLPNSTEAKMPYFLSSEHMKTFPVFVELYDKHGNMIQVRVLKSNVDCYFTNGWNRLADIYDLRNGGKVKMILVRHDRLLIEVSNRLGINLSSNGPPRILRLDQQPVIPGEDDINFEPLDHSVYLGQNPISVFTLHKRLIPQDISTIYLHLAMDFCNMVYTDGGDVGGTIIDPYGNAYQ